MYICMHRHTQPGVSARTDRPTTYLRLRAAEDEVAGAEDGALLLLRELEEIGAPEGLARHVLLPPEDVHVAGWGWAIVEGYGCGVWV